MKLSSLFDILRGYPREGAIDEVFPIHVSSGTYSSVTLGMVVSVGTDGTVQAATSPNRSSANGIATWVVIAGNEDFSGTYLEEAVCLRANAELKLDPSNLTTGSFTVGTKLSFNAGQWTPATTNNQIIGEVLSNNQSVDGTIVVYYTGGDAASF
jgi:hypothetical protein